AAQYLGKTESFHRFDGRRAIRSRCRIGNGDLVEFTIAQCLLTIHEIGILAEENDLADRIREQTIGNGELVSDQFFGGAVVRRKKYLERRSLRDLRVELSGRPEAQYRFMAGLALKELRNLLGRLGEISGDGNIRIGGMRERSARGCH